MSALQVRGVTGAVALSAGVAKTVFQITAPTNQRLKLTNLSVSFDGTTNTATPAQVRVLRQTAGSQVFGTSAQVPSLVEPELTETPRSTYSFNATTEPTAGAVLSNFTVPVFMGNYEAFFPFSQEIIIPAGGLLGVEINAPASVNARITAQWEE